MTASIRNVQRLRHQRNLSNVQLESHDQSLSTYNHNNNVCQRAANTSSVPQCQRRWLCRHPRIQLGIDFFPVASTLPRCIDPSAGSARDWERTLDKHAFIFLMAVTSRGERAAVHKRRLAACTHDVFKDNDSLRVPANWNLKLSRDPPLNFW
jgi:hypothetical protein